MPKEKLARDYAERIIVDYELDTQYGDNGVCECYPDYCRCSSIVGVHSLTFDPIQLAYAFIDSTDEPEQVRKQILVKLSKDMQFDQDDFEPETFGGYYGDELHGWAITGPSKANIDLLVSYLYGDLETLKRTLNSLV